MPHHSKKRAKTSGASSSNQLPAASLMHWPQFVSPFPPPGLPFNPFPGSAALATSQGAEQSKATRAESDSSSFESSSSPEVQKDMALHRGATFICRLPKVRLQQMLESVNALFDAPLTSSLDNFDLCRLIWVFTRTQPDVKTCFLRAKSYKELCRKMRRAGKRVSKTLGPVKYQEVLDELAMLTPDMVSRVAEREGFCERWFPAKVAPKRHGKGAQAASQGIVAEPPTVSPERPPQQDEARAPQLLSQQQQEALQLEWRRESEAGSRQDTSLQHEALLMVRQITREHRQGGAVQGNVSNLQRQDLQQDQGRQQSANVPQLQAPTTPEQPPSAHAESPEANPESPDFGSEPPVQPQGGPAPPGASSVPSASDSTGGRQHLTQAQLEAIEANRCVALLRRACRHQPQEAPGTTSPQEAGQEQQELPATSRESSATPAPSAPEAERQPQQPQQATPQAQSAKDTNMCVICQEVLGSEELTALACAHVFHSVCLEKFMVATGRTMEEACPYRCAQSLGATAVELHDDDGADGRTEAQGDTSVLAAATAVAQAANQAFV